MLKTELSLEASNGKNLNVLRLFDTSKFCETETIENYLVEVLPANGSTWIPFHVAKNFSLALNSSNLKFTPGILSNLPDGIYEIKQSYKPNSYTISHTCHMRITKLSNAISSERAKLITGKCDITREEYYTNLSKLREIEEYILASKWIVEECLEKEEGKELYEFAQKMLNEYTNGCKCK